MSTSVPGGTFALALESLCRRIVICSNDKRKNDAIIQSVGALSLHVLQIILAGKVQPSLMPMMRPFFDLVRRYPHALVGSVAAQCLGVIVFPPQPRVTERFQIFGVNAYHNNQVDAKAYAHVCCAHTSLPFKIFLQPP